MINPNLLQVGYEKHKHPSLPGGKVYFPLVGRRCRRGNKYLDFRTATLAEGHAKKVHARWIRLYNKAIELQVIEPSQEVAIDPAYAQVIANADAPAEEAEG